MLAFIRRNDYRGGDQKQSPHPENFTYTDRVNATTHDARNCHHAINNARSREAIGRMINRGVGVERRGGRERRKEKNEKRDDESAREIEREKRREEEEEEEERAVKDAVRDHCIATADSVEDPEIPKRCYASKTVRLYRRCINSTFTRISRSRRDRSETRLSFAPIIPFASHEIREIISHTHTHTWTTSFSLFLSPSIPLRSSANHRIDLRSPRRD